MFWFFAIAYALSVGIVFAVAHFGPFAWFNYNAVIWFGGFLAVVLALVYLLARRQQSGGSGTARASKHSKGARGDDR